MKSSTAALTALHDMVAPRSCIRLHRLVGLFALLVGLSAGQFPDAAVAQRPPLTPEKQFAEAFKLYTNQMYVEAAQAFERFRTAYPDHLNVAEALYYEAEATLALGQEDEAVRLLTEFQQRYPVHPLAFEARLALGKYFYETQTYDRAIVTLKQVLAENPPPETAAKALYWMGESALNQEAEDEALGYFQQAAEQYRNTAAAPAALYAIAYTQVRLKRYDEAARTFEVLGTRYPESAYARDIGLALAEVYYEIAEYRRVIEEITRRLPQLDGEAEQRATFLLAESYNQLRDHENAIVYYRRFTEGNPASPYYRRALYGLAWNYHFQGAYQWAADQFALARKGHTDELAEQATYYEAVNRKLAKQPQAAVDLYKEVAFQWPNGTLAPHAQLELGVTYYEQRMWKEADEAFKRLVETYPDAEEVGEALNLRGNTSIALGNFDEALRSFDRAIALEAASPTLKEEIIFQKAWLLYRNGDYAAAGPAFLALYEKNARSERAGEALFWAAESYYQTANLDRATRLFRQYMRDFQDGKHVDAAHYALGWTYFKQGRYQDAVGEFERFLAAYRDQNEHVPYRTDALLRLADSYYALKRYPEAIRVYTRVATEGEDYALYQIGQAYYNAGDAFEAIATFRRLLSEYPDSQWREEARYTLGYSYFQNQDYDQAIAEYRQLIETHPRDPLAAKAQYGIGDALFNAGQLEASVAAYREVLDRYPSSPFAAEAASSIQYAYVAMGDDAKADEMLESFAAENPGSPMVDELRLRQAVVKFQSGRTDEALEDFQAFANSSQHPDLLPEAYYYLGTIYLSRDQEDEGERYLRQLIDNYPNSAQRAEAARQLGQYYLAQERYRDALALYQTMETMAPGNARLVSEARYGQGMALLKLDRPDEAERLLRGATQAAPDAPESIPAQLGLARVYEARRAYPQAIALYRHIVDVSQDEIGAEALYRLGELLLRREDPRGALEELSRMTVLYPGYTDWIAQGYLVQARAFRSLGQRGDAVRLYDRVIDEYGDTPYAQAAAREKEAL